MKLKNLGVWAGIDGLSAPDAAAFALRVQAWGYGAHPYNVTPEHTRQARAILGAGKLLCVEQGAILETNPAAARAMARRFLAMYLGLPNYVDNWRRLGFTDAGFAGGGSDRLVDALICWGDRKAFRPPPDGHRPRGA